MSYLVLSRKYRPQSLDELVGQNHIVESIKGAVASGRVAHAYIFCGPRGIGKTSCARILAMCLNAEGGPRVDPDPASPLCREIAAGASFDVLEIDGASNRGIDEVRALRENVKFAPAAARYKIYIVDEVHMLTSEAFNALLKTLEEPPPYVKFIFATTEPHKVPDTILSRCQRFDFKRVGIPTMVDLLKDIAAKEKLEADDEAFYAIAKAARGGLRDALGILDQLGALIRRRIKGADVCSMLGLVELDLLFELGRAVGQRDGTAALLVLQDVVDRGKDTRQLCRDLIEHFRNLMVVKVGGVSLSKLVEYPAAVKQRLEEQAGIFPLKRIILALDIIIEAQETARVVESSRLPLELALMKLTFREEKDENRPAEVELKGPEVRGPSGAPRPVTVPPPARPGQGGPALNPPGPGPRCPGATASASREMHVATADEIKVSRDGELTMEKVLRLWDTLTSAVSVRKMSAATFLQEGTPLSVSGGKIVIGFSPKCQFHKEGLEDSVNRALVREVFSEKLGGPVDPEYVISEDHAPRREDDEVRNALDAFGGQVVNRWHTEQS
jgi:DNA polymerase-3 subunit gamma/tau